MSIETTQETSYIQDVQMVEAKLISGDREITEQDAKKNRAIQGVKRYAKLLRTNAATYPKPTNDEEDFLIRNLRDIGTVVLTELNKLMIKEPELVVPIKTLMMSLGINAPSRALSRVSSRASSDRGDWSASSSRAGSRPSLQVFRTPSVSNFVRSDKDVPPLPRASSKPQITVPTTNLNGILFIMV